MPGRRAFQGFVRPLGSCWTCLAYNEDLLLARRPGLRRVHAYAGGYTRCAWPKAAIPRAITLTRRTRGPLGALLALSFSHAACRWSLVLIPTMKVAEGQGGAQSPGFVL